MLCLLLVGNGIDAQTLSAGDIAFIGINADGNDIATFITLADLPQGEILYFTDEGWKTTQWGNQFEGHRSWTIPTGGVSCGTFISIDFTGQTITGASGTLVTEIGGFNMFTAGDQILVYQGNSVRTTNPTFITGIHTDYNSSNYNASTGWSASVNTGGAECTLPIGLTNGVNAVALFDTLEYDNEKYVGTLTGTSDALRTYINDPSNWVFDNSTPYDLAPWSYSPSNVNCAATPVCTMTAAISAQTNIACAGESTGAATVTASSDTAPYTYLWSNGATTESITGVAAGTYTVTITDTNGRFITETVTMGYADTIAPVAVAASLADVTAQCVVAESDVTVPTATDNCSAVTVTHNVTFPITAQGTTVITWTYADAAGNQSTQTQNVIITDTTAPVANAASLPTITMQCAVLSTDIPVSTATDNCAGVVTATTTDALSYDTTGTYTITWSYNDGNGNTTTQTQTIVVLDSALDAVTFTGETVTYDTTSHAIVVSNLPAGATVSYSISPSTGLNNAAVDAGTYTVTATVSPAANAPNCDAIVLTATLIIEQATQEIIFDPLALMHLETDPDFQLTAYTTSGLPVYYTYTYTAVNPPATVSNDGWVTLLTSGLIEITAHQDGNNNYLPATPVMQPLQINSNDASIHEMTIGENSYVTPGGTIHYLMDCSIAEDAVYVNITTEANATAVPGHEFYIDTLQPGIFSQEVTVTSQDGTNTQSFTIIVERMFPFFDIVVQKFDNVLLANNNPETNGGYSFVAYEWFKNGELIGTDQYVTAGPDRTDLLDANADYYLRLTTASGDVLQTCIGHVTYIHDFSITVTPNPVLIGKQFTVTADFPIEELKDMQIAMYDLTGRLVYSTLTSTQVTTVPLADSIQPATYLVVCTTANHQQTFKIVVH